ncbi:sialidase family protein [Dyadobacter psychrotolerans]|nr:exo-alpha-sialidase [Dyadobacter psychrotolerans]
MNIFLAKLGLLIALPIFLAFQADLPRPADAEYNLGTGSQPEIAIDENGTVRIVYGVKNGDHKDLYFVSSNDGGKSFSKPDLLGNFSKMGLGMGRGPQIVTTAEYTVVTVGDHNGDLFSMRLTNADNQWSAPVKVTDTDSTAKEALSGLSAGKGNDVYTVWLDSRLGNNNLYGSLSRDGGLTWEKNQLIYQGEQKGICDCCKPTVSFDQSGSMHVMFRNKLDGARNMYLISSKDNGKHFSTAQKLGTGDFMIDGCPMDGGDLAADENGKVTTVWRRQLEVYIAEPEKPEIKLGAGRTPVILQTGKGPAIAWQKDGAIQFRSPNGQKTVSIGNGQYPKLALMADKKTSLCVFERDGQILVKPIVL